MSKAAMKMPEIKDGDEEALEIYPTLAASALQMMEADYPYIFGIDELAQMLEVSKNHLIRQFTRAYGISPGKKLTQIRMDHARRLLMEEDYPVGIVGQMTGYANGNYFCKVFKSQMGVTPKTYRQQNAQRRRAKSRF